jgi:hypothetical protein
MGYGVPMTNITTKLADRLRTIQEEKDALDEEARELMRTVRITDEHLPHTVEWWGTARARYLLVQPDGSIYHGVPGTSDFGGVTFQQRPAAERWARSKPGCRIYDVKTESFIPTP